MTTWRELVALVLRDPEPFAWLIGSGLALWAASLVAVFRYAYWQRGKRERAKMEGLEQHLRYMKQKEADLRGAYEAEWHLRTNNKIQRS
jgi:hypothetical protein